MTSPDDAGNSGAARSEHATPDHAGSVLCRLLIGHPDVVDIEILGQAEIVAGITSYSLGVLLPGGRELYIDVEDAPVTPPGAAGPPGAAAPPGAAGPPAAAGPAGG
jgi:hypothetical protein